MRYQYVPKYAPLKKVVKSNGESEFFQNDHMNAAEDICLSKNQQIGGSNVVAGTDLITILKNIGSGGSECKINSISKNGTTLPIDPDTKNVNIVVPIESINLNGVDLAINETTRKATGLVKSTLPIPNNISFTPMSSLDFCAAICDLDTCKVGVIYSGYSKITDAPCNGCEVTVSVMKDESEDWGSHAKVLVLRMNSTNHMEKGWVTMYHNEEMKYGTYDCPWETEIMVPVIRTPGTYTLECTVTDDSVSYQWVAK